MTKMANEMNQLFNDIISECKSDEAWLLLEFSDSVRNRLEKYERNVRKEIVSRLEDNCAPLYYACDMGHVEMIEYLISTCDADVEQKGCLRKVMCWLECAVELGAHGNVISDYATTPVQNACGLVKFDVVECLVKHGADIHRADALGRTCLMLPILNYEPVELCEFLLKNGADVNARDRKDKTALHYAIEEQKLDTVKLLLDYGADVTLRSLDNGDALQTACLVQSQPIFDYLVEHGSYSPGRLADANELMGSCCFRDTETALKYWRKAIEIRNSNTVDGNPLAKTPSITKRDCYRNASEFTTLDELNVIALNSDALKIQNLLINERILGEHHRATFEALKRIGTSYTEPFRYQYCFDLCRRALEIGAANYSIPLRDVSDVAKSLVRAMVHSHKRTLEVADGNRDNKEQPRSADVVAIFKLLTSRLVTTQPSSKNRVLWELLVGHYYNVILKCITCLIYLLVKTTRPSEDEAEVRALVRHLVNQNPRLNPSDDTLLHLCVSRENTIQSVFSIPDDQLVVYLFPDFEVTKLLLDCEADVNARNVNGKTPLHIIASCFRNFSNQIVKLLLDHGAHLDTPDKSGSTPAHKLSAKPDNTVNLGNYMTLRCLAAQAIVKYKIQCNDLPASVNQFLDLHRPL